MSVSAPNRAGGIRAAAWAGLGVLVAVRWAIAAADLVPQQELAWSDALTYLLPLLMVSVACAALAVREGAVVERRFWTLLSLASACALVGETYWTWYAVTVDMRGPLFGPYVWFEVSAAAFYAVMIATMTRLGARRLSVRLRLYLDALAAMVAVYPFVYSLWVLPAFAGFEDATALAAWVAAWPVFGVAMLAATIAVMGGYKAFRWRSWERLITASVTIFAVGMTLFPAWYPEMLASDANEANWYSLVMGSGMYVLFVAAVYRFTAGPDESLSDPWPVPSQDYPRFRALYPVGLVAALPLIAFLAYALQGSEADGPVIGAGVLLALLLGLRSWLQATELATHRITAITDPLTGTLTTQLLADRLVPLLDEARDLGQPLSLVHVVVDEFARLDNVHGRDVMDRLLLTVASKLSAVCEPRSEVYRWQDDGFVVVLRDTPSGSAAQCAHRAAAAIEDGAGVPIAVPYTVSFGVASFPEAADNAGDLITCARLAADLAQSQATDVHLFSVEDAAADARTAGLSRGTGRVMLESLESLADAVDARDPATAGHCRGVAELARNLAKSLGMPAEAALTLSAAALLHDVGKIGVDPELLRSAGPLTTDERHRLERHADLSARIVTATGLGRVGVIVRHHHERWDGEGYPDGLRGPAIPLSSRVLAVCDVFETLSAGRHRPALSEADALAEIAAGAGTQFDPDVAGVFVECRSADESKGAPESARATAAP